MELKTPLIYRSSGLCTGGEVDLRVGDAVYTYELAAPACQPHLK